MNAYLSRKLKVISFILIVMVVFLHAHNISMRGDELNYYVQNLISNGFTKISVALFFVISGYLFFFNLVDPKSKDFRRKIQSRVRSILVPYLLWSIWGMIFFAILQNIPFSKGFFSLGLLQNKSSADLLHILFIKPLPYQLWFLRHLFVFVLLSPLIYFTTKVLKGSITLAIIAVLLLKILEIPENDFVHNRSLAYFCLGAYLGIHQQSFVLKRLPSWGIPATVAWIALVVWRIVGDSQAFINDKLWRNFIQHTEYLIGIFALWSLYDLLSKADTANAKALPKFLAFAFFLYAAHEPVLTIIKKISLRLLGSNDSTQLLVYFAAPLLTILFCVTVGMILKSLIPKVYAALSGGR